MQHMLALLSASEDDHKLDGARAPGIRALLIAPSDTLERPVQTFHRTLESAEVWARGILARYQPDASVQISQTVEVLLGTVAAQGAATSGPRETQ